MAGKHPIPPLANALRKFIDERNDKDDPDIETLFNKLIEFGPYGAYAQRPHDDRSFKKELAARAAFLHDHYGLDINITGETVRLRKVKR